MWSNQSVMPRRAGVAPGGARRQVKGSGSATGRGGNGTETSFAAGGVAVPASWPVSEGNGVPATGPKRDKVAREKTARDFAGNPGLKLLVGTSRL